VKALRVILWVTLTVVVALAIVVWHYLPGQTACGEPACQNAGCVSVGTCARMLDAWRLIARQNGGIECLERRLAGAENLEQDT